MHLQQKGHELINEQTTEIYLVNSVNKDTWFIIKAVFHCVYKHC